MVCTNTNTWCCSTGDMYLFLMAAADVQHGHRTVGGTIPCWGDELWCARWGQGLHSTSWLALRHAGWRGVDYASCSMDGLLRGEGTGKVLLYLLHLRPADVVVGGVLQMGLYLPGKNMISHHVRMTKQEVGSNSISIPQQVLEKTNKQTTVWAECVTVSLFSSAVREASIQVLRGAWTQVHRILWVSSEG